MIMRMRQKRTPNYSVRRKTSKAYYYLTPTDIKGLVTKIEKYISLLLAPEIFSISVELVFLFRF